MILLNNKRILLLYARFFEYDSIVKNKLQERGAIVDLFDARANIGSFGKALLKKTDKFYKKKQIKFHKNICKKNRGISYDFILTNENLDYEVLRNYREAFPKAKLLLYLDDSVTNLRHVDVTFKYYDKVLTFDRFDSQKYNILFRPLFFNDRIREARANPKEIESDICFVGTAHSDRLFIIDSLIKSCPNIKMSLYLFLQSWFMYFYYLLTRKEYRKHSFSFFKYKKISMSDVASLMSKSFAILDVQHPKQSGLTMRTIETIGMGKKLITTNKDVVNYDFYNSNNILVIDRKKPTIDEDFFEKQYEEINANTYEKYSIDSWINDIFGE